MPGLPIGTIIEATYSSTLLGQRVMNIYHYKVTTTSSITNVVEEMEAFLAQFTDGNPGKMFGTYTACIPSNMAVDYAVAQPISPVRYIRTRLDLNINGDRAAAATANTQASITVQTDRAGRRFVGRKSIPLGQADYDLGKVEVTAKGALQDHADAMVTNLIAATGGGVYDPVLPHLRVPGEQPTRIQNCFVQPEVRVQRRRTVGLGV